jgi:hypothetical protein
MLVKEQEPGDWRTCLTLGIREFVGCPFFHHWLLVWGLFGRPDIPLVQPARDHHLHNFQNAPPLNYCRDEVVRPTVV